MFLFTYFVKDVFELCLKFEQFVKNLVRDINYDIIHKTKPDL